MSIVFVIDGGEFSKSLTQALAKEHCEPRCFRNATEAIAALEGTGDEVVAVALRSDEALGLLSTSLPAPPKVIAVCSSGDEGARLLGAGARFVVRAPATTEELVFLTLKSFDRAEGNGHRTDRPRSTPNAPSSVVIGETLRMRSLRDRIQAFGAEPERGVLLVGEGGTGKDVVARAIHAATRGAGPFVHVSFCERSEASLEAELFGVERARSGEPERPGLIERAQGGTLYLDEVSLIPNGLQSRVLKFLRESRFRRVGGTSDLRARVRVIASTSSDLRVQVRDKAMSAELARLLGVNTIEIPPLRERLADLPLLVDHFLGELSETLGRPLKGVSASSLELMASYEWPGNVRELKNLLERSVMAADDPLLEIGTLPASVGRPPRIEYELPTQGIVFQEFERQILVQALERCSGNQSRAAAFLRITRDQLRYRMLKFGLRGKAPSSKVTPVLDAPLRAFRNRTA
jgi:DNA-binding NtrC family response regulator